MGRFRARIVRIMAALALVIAAVCLLYPRDTSLFGRATRVARAKDEPGNFYWWLSSHQVVWTRNVNGSFTALYCHDTNTGKDDPLVSLNRLIQAQKAVPRIEALSPDRRVLLLWAENDRQIGVTQDARLLFDDHKTANTPDTGPAFDSYMAGGSRWVEPIQTGRSQIHNMGEYHIARLLIRDGARHTVVKTVTFSPWIDQGFAETITRRNHFLMQQNSASNDFGFPLVSNACLQTIDVDLNAGTPKPQTLTLNLAFGSDPFGVCYSPDGERVAFLRVLDNRLNRGLPQFLQGWWDRLFPHGAALPYKVSLWVSDMRGQRMHEVGSVPSDNNFFVNEGDPQSVQWLPDGKTLSFLARGSVWTVPAD